MRALIKKIDSDVFGGRVLRAADGMLVNAAVEKRRKSHNHRLDIGYGHDPKSLLNVLCDKYGSDKGEARKEGHPYTEASHTYTDVYELLFQLRRRDVQLVVECGLGTNNPNIESNMGVNGKPGASLRVWRDYFPAAKIIGLDNDGDILFQEERIATYQCDQTSPASIKAFVAQAGIQEHSADVIIDDGLHEFRAGVCLLENLIDYLSLDGCYVIEDVTIHDYFKYIEYFSRQSRLRSRFIDLHRPNMRVANNRMIVLTWARSAAT